MSSAMRTTLQTVPESLATDHVTNSKVRLYFLFISLFFILLSIYLNINKHIYNLKN